MEAPLTQEPVDEINEKLLKNYGKFHGTTLPNWRVAWSDSQLECRRGVFHYFDNSGNFLRSEVGIQEVKKYGYFKERYVLERLMPVYGPNADEIKTDSGLSYEPVWIFQDNSEQYLEPIYRACEFVVIQVMKQAAKSVGAKYKDPDSDPQAARHNKEERLNQIQLELFGNETATGDLLHYKEGVTVPSNYPSTN